MHFLGSIATIFFAIAGIAAAHNVPRATPTATRCDAQVFVKSSFSRRIQNRTMSGKLTGNKLSLLDAVS
jgi:hypothetical protein